LRNTAKSKQVATISRCRFARTKSDQGHLTQVRTENRFYVQIEYFWAVISLLILCACATRFAQEPTDADRAETLRTFSFDATMLQTVATKRCAILLSGGRLQTTCADSRSITLRANGPPDSVLTLALAASVDQRGYFLTAAHLTEHDPITLIFYDGRKVRAERARVVAKLSNPEKEIESRLDLAILFVNVSLSESFRWADAAEIRRNDPALEIGATSRFVTETNGIIETVCFAGRVEKISRLPDGGTILKTDLLTRNGDSGGPLVNAKGELLGVHIATGHGAFERQSLVNRPDLSWLQNAIAADQSIPRSDMPSSVFLDDWSEPVQITINLLPP
jgi:hypothetical protein